MGAWRCRTVRQNWYCVGVQLLHLRLHEVSSGVHKTVARSLQIPARACQLFSQCILAGLCVAEVRHAQRQGGRKVPSGSCEGVRQEWAGSGVVQPHA